MGHEAGAVRSRVWRHGVLAHEDFPFEQISDYLNDANCLIWVDLCDPDHRRLDQLAEELSLDPLAVEDAVSHRERAKLTRYATHSFLTAYCASLTPAAPASLDQDDTSHGDGDGKPETMRLDRISAFVLRNGIVTVRLGSGFDVNELLRRWDDNADLLPAGGVGALLHGLLDQIVDSHFEAVQAMDDAIESIEDELFDDRGRSTEVQRQSYRMRRDLVQLRRVVLPMREVVSAAMRQRREFDSAAILDPWYEDLYDHVLRVAEWTESLRDMVATIFETNLSLQNARLNDVMKKLTAWAAIIAVPTAVTGFYGQNVPYPGFGTHAGFVVSVVVLISIATVLFGVFRSKRWI